MSSVTINLCFHGACWHGHCLLIVSVKLYDVLAEAPAHTITAGSKVGWGEWFGPKKCPKGSYVVGYRQRVEGHQHVTVLV
jgi:hypothetical protein